MKISQVTRRDIFDAITSQGVKWSGRHEEPEFLSRIYDLSGMPSTDRRFNNARDDIWQHRVNNFDWPNDWVFYDSRFDLMNGDDELLLRFLAETIHPIIRSDPGEATRLCQLYNEFLKNDGFELVEQARLSSRPVYSGREIGIRATPAIAAARKALTGLDPGYVARQITRMEGAVSGDPDLAIGTAKELVETCCKTILAERRIEYDSGADIPQLVKLTSRELKLVPAALATGDAAETVTRLLGGLGNIVQSIATLRNRYGTGHGREGGTTGLQSSHARLAVGAASTLATFLFESHQGKHEDNSVLGLEAT